MKSRPNMLLRDALREISHTKSRFLSILILSALAVAFLAGLRTTAPDMEATADSYFDTQSLMDVRVLSTLGLTDDDIAALSRQPGVAAAEGSWTVDALYHGDDKDLIVKLHSLSPTGLNQPELLEGRLPQAPNECVAETAFLQQSGLTVGDTVTLDSGTGDFEDALNGTRFTIVGRVNSPLYIFTAQRGTSTLGTGKVAAFLLLPPAAFHLDYYTDAYLLLDGAKELHTYSDGYQDLTDGITSQLETLGDQRAALRYDQVVGEATATLNDAQQEFDDAERETDTKLAYAETELADARRELDRGWQQTDDGWATLRRETQQAQQEMADGLLTLDDAKSDLDQGELDYTDGSAELTAAKLELDDGKVQLDDGWMEYQDAATLLADKRQEYETGKAEYEQGLTDYLTGKADLDQGEADYTASKAKLDQGEIDYANGLVEYNAGEATLATAKQQIDEGEEALKKASASLSSGQNQYDSGLTAYNEGKAQYDAGKSQLEGGLSSLAQLLGGTLTNEQLLASFEDPAAVTAMSAQLEATRTTLQATIDQLTLLGDEASLAQAAILQAQLDALNAAVPVGGFTAVAAQLVNTSTLLTMSNAQLTQAKAQLDDANSALMSGWAKYRRGKAELAEAKTAYEDGLKQWQDSGPALEEARITLDDGWKQLADGRTELDEGWVTLNDAKATLDEAEATLNDGRVQLEDGETKLTAAKRTLEASQLKYNRGMAKYADGLRTLNNSRSQLDTGWREYQDGMAKLYDADVTLTTETATARRELTQAERDLNDGEVEYYDGLRDYQEGKEEADQELSDARKKLNDARREIAKIENCKWYVLDRNTNAGFVSYQQDAERMGNLASVFPLIFFLVAALVCLTTMARMVEEQRVQIGGMKALGYSKGAIALKYVGYGLIASLLGGLLGLAVGLTSIPLLIYTAWETLYTLGDLVIVPSLSTSLLSVGAAVLTVTGAAVWASFSTLTAVPAQLMRPKAPPAGKRVLLERIPALWRRLAFSQKVTIRNLFRYKKRFWMTVIGIGGCAALIVAGFGLRDSIFDVMDRQYDQLYQYQSHVGLADDVTNDELIEIQRTLTKSPYVHEFMPIYQTAVTAESDQRAMDVSLFSVEQPEDLASFIVLRQRLGHAPVELGHTGAVITEKLASMLGVKVGDSFTMTDGDRRVTVPISGITENYIMHYVYLSHDLYAQLYGQPPATNQFLCRYVDDSIQAADGVSAALLPLAGITSVSGVTETRHTFTKSMESVDYAVVVIIFAAAALAFVVLYNLTNINITERLRELATLKVLGFYDGELAAYVYRENALLTVFGILLGLLMGKFLHQYLVLTVEIEMVMFGREAKLLSYAFAVGLTLLFSLLVNLAARKRLKRINMVESLKMVE